MKKQIFAIIFTFAISVSINATKANAQSEVIRVDVPFAFNANDKTLPKGTYTLRQTTDMRVVWRLQNRDQKTAVQIVAGIPSGVMESGNVQLTFRRYGARHFLIGFKTSSYQVRLPTSGSEKDFRRVWNGHAKNDLATVEMVSKK